MRKIGVKAPIPGFIEPQLATLKTKPPKGDHEIKFDGYRAQVVWAREARYLYAGWSRLDEKGFSPIIHALDIDISAIMDGEIVVIEDNRTNFSLLQADLARGRKDSTTFSIVLVATSEAALLIQRKGICRKLRSPVFTASTLMSMPKRYSRASAG